MKSSSKSPKDKTRRGGRVRIVIQSDIQARIEGDFDDRALDAKFAFVKNKFWFRSAAARSGFWDGKTHLFHRNSGTFPLGLLPDVLAWCKAYDVRAKVHDKRTSKILVPHTTAPQLEDGPGKHITLREDQVTAVCAALVRERGIIHGATGAGKTELAAAIIKSLACPVTLFLTGRKKLARQTRERFARRLGVPVKHIGFIQGGNWEPARGDDTPIYVAVVDTLVSPKFKRERATLYKNCQLLFLDEAHHGGSTTWYNTVRFCKARYRYGLTGTPEGRSDGGDLYLKATTGPVVARIAAKDLIAKGILAKPTIIFTKVRKPLVVQGPEDVWNDVYRRAVVDNKHRNKMIIDYANGLSQLGKKTLILVKEKPHGFALEQLIKKSKFLHGSLSDDAIDRGIEALVRGKLNTIIATSIFDEGVDVPAINAIINAAGGKSVITTLQRIGRGLRKKEDDNRLLVLDFLDVTNKHLEKHARARLQTVREEEFTTKILKKPRSIERLVTLM